MKKYILYKLLLLAFFTFWISAGFGQSANVVKGCVPLEVQFQAGNSLSSYYWDFKDGVTSNLENPSTVFTQAGTYEVSLSSSVEGATIGTVTIQVYETPDLKIQAVQAQGCAPHTTQFENITELDPSIGVINTIWVWGDGTSTQNTNTPTRTYNNLGKYDVSFSIETEVLTCNKTKLFTDVVEVVQKPQAFFTTDPTNLISCTPPLTVNFTDQSTSVAEHDLQYSWDFGNSNTSASSTPSSQNYIEEGQFTAALTVSYAFGCQSSYTRGITIGNPVAEIKSEDTLCLGAGTSFSSPNGGFLTWDFGPNATPSTATGSSPSTVFNTVGTHTVQLTVQAPGSTCSDVITKQVFVDEVTAELTVDPEYSCETPTLINYVASSNLDLNSASFEWAVADTTADSVLTFQYEYIGDTLPIGKYEVHEDNSVEATLVVTSKLSGCQASASVETIIGKPTAIAYPLTALNGCAPLELYFGDSSHVDTSNYDIVEWTWIYGDGEVDINNSIGDSTVQHTYTQSGEYELQLVIKNNLGCVDTSAVIQIEVGDDVTSEVDFTVSKSEICRNESVTYQIQTSNTNLDDWEWHFSSEGNRVFHCSKEEVVNWTYKYETGQQDVSLVLDYNGCFSALTKEDVVKIKGPIAKIDYEAFCEDPLTYNFNNESLDATSVTWKFGDNETSTDNTTPHTYQNQGDYVVELIAENASSGCGASSAVLGITAIIVKAKIEGDSLLCLGSEYSFDGSKSKNNYVGCYRGFTWFSPTKPDERPYTSMEDSFDFTFDESGKHIVQLVVEDVNGCKDTASFNVEVYDIDVNPIASQVRICTPNSIDFSEASTGDTTLVEWSWSFGDGEKSTEQSITHQFLNAPTGNSFNVQLTVKDTLQCTKTESINISHYVPVSIITISDQSLCAGDSVKITGTDVVESNSKLDLIWDFGNGETSINTTEHDLLYDTAGTFTVSVDVTEIATGCVGTSSKSISVQDYPIAGIDVNTDTLDILCNPQNMVFKDNSQSTSSFSNYWDFGNGATSSAATYSLFYTKGIWNTQHIVRTSHGCADTTYKEFEVVGPEGNFSIDKNLICKGEGITFTILDTTDVWSYKWAFGDGIVIENEAPITHNYNFHPPSGQTLARLILEGEDGACPVEIERAINIYQVIAEFDRLDGIDSTICTSEGAFVFNNTSTSSDNYLWSFGDGTTSTESGTNLSHLYPSAGTYTVSLEVSNDILGCQDSIAKQVVVYDNPIVTAINDTICLGNTVTLQIENPDTSSIYTWKVEDVIFADSTILPTIDLQETTNIIVAQLDTNDCRGSDSLQVVVIPPSPFVDLDTTVVVGDQVVLKVWNSEIYKFTWNPETSLSCLDCDYPVSSTLEDITYNLEVKDVRNCFEASNTFNIVVRPETFIKMPTTFSPNGDHTNDVLYVRGWGIKELVQYEVYNRWGSLIYSSTDIEEGWDGTFDGTVQNSDVYTYKVKVMTWRDEELYQEGYINLMH